MSFAEVAVDAPIRPSRTFSYAVPDHLTVDRGQMVQVPFGPRMADGIVFDVAQTPQFSPVRPIATTDADGPLLSSVQLGLARWIGHYYLSPLFAAAALMLPPSFRSRTRPFLSLPQEDTPKGPEEPRWQRVVDQFDGRPRKRIAEEVLRRVLDDEGERAIDRWVRRGLLVRHRWLARHWLLVRHGGLDVGSVTRVEGGHC